ncbi:thiol-disulfide oxidoreductase DCC family protein [Nitrospirillum sp. BR 11828]|uniref:thiol-disulfide oxidoreductase DCC family protein n=1 Tax=Nitrospirillum sp. BR 11828 TaxID=3104325 RepID=UPI002ACA5706|nr:DCC1-like thiol-disulfide oxidoreductase family protein [Nitrospirillum sp. BR 11828]MDZ5646755.1 DCC1-like thiol-disulfide oxidoreductase family protein [Nitrospirillum sp. BR 11828]
MAAYSYRDDPSVPAFPDDKPIIVFDGHCVLCSGFAQFVMRHDPAGRFRLMAAQTPLGAALYRHYGLDPVDYQTNLVLEDGVARVKSDSSIRVFECLGFPWSLLTLARLLPRPLRDALYSLVARNRLRWFGARAVCYLPTPEQRDRFIL